jgi:HK97 gp10 family phage protein
MAEVTQGSRLEGVAQLTRQLKELGKLDDGKALRDSTREGMRPAFRAAQQAIPVGTKEHRTYKGRLVGPGFAKRNLKLVVSLSKDKQRATAMIGVTSEAFYAVQFVELGTSRQAAQPWLRPAFYGTKQNQIGGIEKGLRKAIEKAAKT